MRVAPCVHVQPIDSASLVEQEIPPSRAQFGASKCPAPHRPRVGRLTLWASLKRAVKDGFRCVHRTELSTFTSEKTAVCTSSYREQIRQFHIERSRQRHSRRRAAHGAVRPSGNKCVKEISVLLKPHTLGRRHSFAPRGYSPQTHRETV